MQYEEYKEETDGEHQSLQEKVVVKDQELELDEDKSWT